VTVKVSTPPTPGISPNQTICDGTTVPLSASGGSTYKWSTGSTTRNINVIPAATTKYYVTISNGACSVKDSVTITVNPSPFVSINPKGPVTIISGQTVLLSATPAQSYAWPPAAGLSCTNCQTPVASPTVTTTYYLTV